MTARYIFFSSAWALVILILTLVPGSSIPGVPIFGIDKIVHALLFGMLMFLVANSYPRTLSEINKQLLFAFSLCIAYGMIIEIIQQYIPGRSFSIYDMIANSLGVILGYAAFKMKAKK